MNLSKSRYTEGITCGKKLWLSCYKKEEAEDMGNESILDKTSSNYFESTSNTPYWLNDAIGDYWIMNSNNNTVNKSFIKVNYNHNGYIYEVNAYDTLARVRPVINVYKSALK